MERLSAPETPSCLCPLWEWQQSTGVRTAMSMRRVTCFFSSSILGISLVLSAMAGLRSQLRRQAPQRPPPAATPRPPLFPRAPGRTADDKSS